MMIRFKFFLPLIGGVLLLSTSGFSQPTDTSVVSLKESITLKDEPIDTYQSELLDLAFETASLIPVNPHIKDRSRIQEEVVAASLELDQPQRALNFIEKIGDWRRGAGYSDLAFYCAQRGYTDGVKHYLDLAAQISDAAEDWRKDVIKVKIAKTYTLLGQTQEAKEFEKDIVDSEIGKVAGVRAMMADKDSFNEQIKMMDELIESENFEIVKNALKSGTELFNKFYEDNQKRSLVEDKIKTSWNKLPLFIRIELLMDLGRFALDHGDKDKSLTLVNEAQDIFDGAEWPLEHHIPMLSKLIELRAKAGDKRKAKIDADALRDLFEVDGNKIVNIYRAGALRPLAQAYQSLGDTTSALAIYRKAVEESVENPNSRPRAEDLSATLISMASNQVEPDQELWKRIREINQGLGNPW